MNKEELLQYFKSEALKQQKIIKPIDQQIDDIKLHYGSISNFYDRLYFKFSKEELIELFKNIEKELGRTPSETEIGLPIKIFENAFGSWKLMLKEIYPTKSGINKTVKTKTTRKLNDKINVKKLEKPSKVLLLNILKELYEQLGRLPKIKDLKNLNNPEDVKQITHHNYVLNFGSWGNALREAGLKQNSDEILEIIKKWVIENDRSPCAKDFNREELPSYYILLKNDLFIRKLPDYLNEKLDESKYIHIKDILTQNKVSQIELAKLLGVSQQCINYSINNKKYLSESSINKIALIFNIDKNLIIPQRKLKHIYLEPKYDEWDIYYNLLKDFQLLNSHTNVPKNYIIDNYTLGRWVRVQRYNNKNISKEKIDKLNELNFIWYIQENSWEHKFNELVNYKKKYGNLIITNNYIINNGNSLAQWTWIQRKKYKNGKLNNKEIEMLNSIGFEWEVDIGYKRRYEKRHFVRLEKYRMFISSSLISTNKIELTYNEEINAIRIKSIGENEKGLIVKDRRIQVGKFYKRFNINSKGEFEAVWDDNEQAWTIKLK